MKSSASNGVGPNNDMLRRGRIRRSIISREMGVTMTDFEGKKPTDGKCKSECFAIAEKDGPKVD